MALKWTVTPRQRCDLEMILVGGFAPLQGFLSRVDYESVLERDRLASGALWPVPVTLDVDEGFAGKVSTGETIDLCDWDGTLLAHMAVSDKWQPDKQAEAQAAFGTQDAKHPAVDYLLNRAGNWYLGGTVKQVMRPVHYDFASLRHTPAALKEFFARSGWKRVVGFQTRNPLHRAHMELTLRAAKEIDGHLLIHPVVGMTKPGDVDHFTRVRCYEKLLAYYPPGKAALSLLPLAMRMAGPKCALAHALIRKNYGCSHFIVGRAHADPGLDSKGKPFYGPYDAQTLLKTHEKEMGIGILPFEEVVYVKERKQYCTASELKPGETALTISGTQLRAALLGDEALPAWFSFPEVIKELRRSCPPRHAQGMTLFFTGLSGAGKTTLAQALMAALMEEGKKNVISLDGDEVRKVLTSGLGFTRADRDMNIRRIGYVASETTRAGGIVLCAAIAPYAAVRGENRRLITQHGGYVEIYVSTPIEVCEERDVKGLYAKARAGELKGFTGIDDPYELPVNPEITIDTSRASVQECVQEILRYLETKGYLKREVQGERPARVAHS
jgi:sulfate adenylyltransferase